MASKTLQIVDSFEDSKYISYEFRDNHYNVSARNLDNGWNVLC